MLHFPFGDALLVTNLQRAPHNLNFLFLINFKKLGAKEKLI